jgi:hypothetical protein
MYDAGKTVAATTRELRLTRRIVDKLVRLESLPERAPGTRVECGVEIFHVPAGSLDGRREECS